MLAVRVDNSAQPNSRWYSGSGIYRHVRVIVTDPIHVAHWGVFVTTPEASSAVGQGLDPHASGERIGRRRPASPSRPRLLDKAGKRAGSAQSKLTIAPGKRRRSRAGDRGRESRPVVAGFARAVPRRVDGSQRRQGHRRGDDALRHPHAGVVGRKRTAAERQAHQADGRQRPSRQRAARRCGVRSRRRAQGRAAESGRAQRGANGAQSAVARVSGCLRPARPAGARRAVRHLEGAQGQVRLRQRLR